MIRDFSKEDYGPLHFVVLHFSVQRWRKRLICNDHCKENEDEPVGFDDMSIDMFDLPKFLLLFVTVARIFSAWSEQRSMGERETRIPSNPIWHPFPKDNCLTLSTIHQCISSSYTNELFSMRCTKRCIGYIIE